MSDIQNNNIAEEEITEQDINILKKVRLEKLNELKANNANPYEITKFDVNAKNAEIKLNYEAEEKAIIEAADGNEEVVSADLTNQGKNRVYCRTYYELARYGQGKLY